MPKVKLLTSMAGIDFSHNVAILLIAMKPRQLRFIAAGIAEPVETAVVERAVKTPITRKAVKVEERIKMYEPLTSFDALQLLEAPTTTPVVWQR
jgi:hypothetical protein